LKNIIKDYLFLILIAGAVILLDQVTKELVRQNVSLGESWSPFVWLVPYARIINWKNSGAAFGMLQGFSMVFTVLAIIVSLAILYYFPQVSKQDRYLRLALGLQLGGAVGNLIDRLTQGYVTDFISVGSFPVFNVADSSITLGVAVLIIGMWIKEKKDKQSQLDQQINSSPEKMEADLAQPSNKYE
jgi:signal peptidase II